MVIYRVLFIYWWFREGSWELFVITAWICTLFLGWCKHWCLQVRPSVLPQLLLVPYISHWTLGNLGFHVNDHSRSASSTQDCFNGPKNLGVLASKLDSNLVPPLTNTDTEQGIKCHHFTHNPPPTKLAQLRLAGDSPLEGESREKWDMHPAFHFFKGLLKGLVSLCWFWMLIKHHSLDDWRLLKARGGQWLAGEPEGLLVQQKVVNLSQSNHNKVPNSKFLPWEERKLEQGSIVPDFQILA